MTTRKALLGAAIAVLAGCTNMADMASQMGGMGVISEEQSTFDGSQIVRVTPAPVYESASKWGAGMSLGAYWTDAAPDVVALEMEYSSVSGGGSGSYIGLRGMEIKVGDAPVRRFRAGGMTDMDYSSTITSGGSAFTSSSNHVMVPYSFFEKMLEADDVRARILTSEGYVDADMDLERGPGGQGTAMLYFKEFAKKLAPYRATAASAE